jgi:hypothetical protein
MASAGRQLMSALDDKRLNTCSPAPVVSVGLSDRSPPCIPLLRTHPLQVTIRHHAVDAQGD